MVTAVHPKLHIRDLIKPFPKQAALLDAMYSKEYILYGGAAGPGKSYILRWALVELLLHWAAQGHQRVRVGLFCEAYPVLRDRQIVRIEREFPPWLGELKESQDEGLAFILAPEYGGGVIALRNLDDPAKYASAEFAAIAVDELTKNDRQTFDDLRFRKRWPGIEHSPFIAGSNPGSRGHAWVKRLWLDRDFSGDDDDQIDPDSFLFLRALPRDNPHLPQSYWRTLHSLPVAMRRAMEEGDWDVFAGQVFAEWRRDFHVCEPFPVPTGWTRWVAIDYGYVAPFCALWFARPPDKSRCYVYRELYQKELRAIEQAQRIVARSQGERIRLAAADPAIWATREGRGDVAPRGARATAGDSYANEYMRVLAPAGIPLVKANNNRLAGLNVVHEALAWKRAPSGIGEGMLKAPYLQIFSTCENLIRTLPALHYARIGGITTEDVDTDAEDHAYDTLRYGLEVDRQSSQAPREVELQWVG